MRRIMLARAVALAVSLAAAPAAAGTKTFTASGYALPADKPVTIVLMRPDVEVGQLAVGGVAQPNADWTTAARDNLAAALAQTGRRRGIEVRVLPDQGATDPTGEGARLVADYEALHRAVAGAIVEHKYYGSKLPTKKDRFDWTMGPGTRRIADLSGGNYALFMFTRDNFSSDSRKALQVIALLGLPFGFGGIVGGGQHVAYASLVELSTGNVVWFNVLRGSKGDIRQPAGAQSMVDAIVASMPTRPGEGPAADKVAAR